MRTIAQNKNARRKEPMRYCAFAPLLNFSSDVEEIKIADNLVIARATEEERALAEQSHTFGILEELFGEWSFVARSTLDASRDKVLGIDELFNNEFMLKAVYTLCTSLRLFKKTLVALGPDYIVQKRPFKRLIEGSGARFHVPEDEEEYLLTREELSDFRSWHSRLCSIDFRNNARLSRALWRFEMSYTTGLLHQIVDLMIGFESLYLAEESELAYKVAMRASFFLGRTTEERHIVYKTLKRAYTLRSTIVHGGDPYKKVSGKDEAEFGDYLEQITRATRDLLRESIKKFVDFLPCYAHDTLLEVTLDDNVLTGGSLLNPQNP
jgi:hypothetical protein